MPEQQQNLPKPAKQHSTPAKATQIHTFVDLIRAAYGAKRKRLAVTKAEIDSIRSGPGLEQAQLEELLRLSSSDRILDKTRELLLLNAERLCDTPLASQIRSFVRQVLGRHPVFLTPSLAGVLDNLPEAFGEDAVVEALSATSFAGLHWAEGAPPLKKMEAEQGRLNAVYCLLLWMRETRGMSMDRVQRYLQTVAWEPTARRHKTEAQQIRLLMQTRDRAALGVICSIFEKKVRGQSQEALTARAAEERATARATELHGDLEQTNAQLESEKVRAQNLATQIDASKREFENEMAHMRDDYEELRGRVLYRLRQEVSLLDEGLQALKRQPPKVHVMEDHAERVIQGLKGEIERIKGES